MAAVPNPAPGAAHTLIERIFRHIDEAGEVRVDELPRYFADADRSGVDYAITGLLKANRITRSFGCYCVAGKERVSDRHARMAQEAAVALQSKRRCRGPCAVEKDKTDFYGNDTTCKECRKKQARERKAATRTNSTATQSGPEPGSSTAAVDAPTGGTTTGDAPPGANSSQGADDSAERRGGDSDDKAAPGDEAPPPEQGDRQSVEVTLGKVLPPQPQCEITVAQSPDSVRANALARKAWLVKKAGEIAQELADLETFLAMYDRLAKEGA